VQTRKNGIAVWCEVNVTEQSEVGPKDHGPVNRDAGSAGVPERSKGQDLRSLFLFFAEKKNAREKEKTRRLELSCGLVPSRVRISSPALATEGFGWRSKRRIDVYGTENFTKFEGIKTVVFMGKKLEMIKLIAGLEKLYRTTEAPIWDDLAYRLGRPSRQAASVNLEQLDKLAKKFRGKTLIVPGKVLGEGELNDNVKIVAVSASEKAMRLAAKKGGIVLMKDFIKTAGKVKVSDLVIVK